MAELYNEMLIRSVDCGLLYFQIKDNEAIKEYEDLKKEKKLMENENADDKKLAKIQKRIEELSKEIFSMKKPITFSDKDNRFYYSGTMADSLMGRKLRQVAKNRGEYEKVIREADGVDYTDLIINLKFKQDIMIPDGTLKKGYDPETDSIVEVGGENTKRLISKKKLRKMAYRDGVTINGMHYVNFQRTSSKARVGNVLFIREDYFEEMDEWQNLGIPFRKMVKIQDKDRPNPFEAADIVSVRSYQSLIASSIMGEIDIDPYSILLIDDVSGQATMDCNVIKPFPTKNGKGMELRAVRESYMQKTDLWDGQSLLDSSVFKKEMYATRDKDGNIKTDNSYENYGFMLLRNHFFKSAAFNTDLQEYYRERFKGIENPIVNDAFGNPFNTKDIMMVTTRNSVKIFKFADIICEYMVGDDKKTYLKELEKLLVEKYEGLQDARSAISSATRKLTILKNNRPATKDEIVSAENNLNNLLSIYGQEDNVAIASERQKKEIAGAKRKLTALKNRKKATPEEIKEAENQLNEAIQYYNENSGRLKKEIESLCKPVKKEQERLTWDWFREIIRDEKFGCCKTEHKSKFGDKQQLWYQVIGSLNFDKEELWELVKPQIDEINLMAKHVAWFKHFANMRATENAKDSMMLSLLDVNDDISRTKWYTDYRRFKINSIINKLVAGKLQIKDSDFCTLVGNPYEMLRASCGEEIETSILTDFECYCPRYEDGEGLYGMRAPHVCSGNNALLKNTYRDEWKWFNFTDNIIVVNFWDKGAFLAPKWNGCDVDSDSAFVGNNPIILEKVRKAQDYLIPINGLSPKPKTYEFTDENMAKVDGQLCNDLIGKICNLARDLQSLYWHLYNVGTEENKQKYLSMMYDDICFLEVLSNIAIDSAKRRYDCNIEAEMKKIKSRPYLKTEGAIIQDDKIIFVEEPRYKKSLSENKIKEYEELVEKRNNATTQKELDEINKEIDKVLIVEEKYRTHMIQPDFTKNLKSQPKKKKRKIYENDEEKELNRQKQIAYAEEQKALKEKIYRKMESPMDILSQIIREKKVARSPRTEYLPCFVDVLKPIPSGKKADYNRINAIKKLCLEANQKINCARGKYKDGKSSYDEMHEEINVVEKDTISNIKERGITPYDINVLIRKVYDIRPKKDAHGKVIKNEKGKDIYVDKRDKELIEAKAGGLLLKYVYAAHKDEFLRAIKENGEGTVSYVRKHEPNKGTSDKVSSLKDVGKLFKKDHNVFMVDGVEYEICTRKAKRVI